LRRYFSADAPPLSSAQTVAQACPPLEGVSPVLAPPGATLPSPPSAPTAHKPVAWVCGRSRQAQTITRVRPAGATARPTKLRRSGVGAGLQSPPGTCPERPVLCSLGGAGSRMGPPGDLPPVICEGGRATPVARRPWQSRRSSRRCVGTSVPTPPRKPGLWWRGLPWARSNGPPGLSPRVAVSPFPCIVTSLPGEGNATLVTKHSPR
jgi:hypothetical protein